MLEVCYRCGRLRSTVTDPLELLAWSCEREAGTERWLCHLCAKVHMRDIESKLPADYW